MPQITILSDKEIVEYDYPPKFYSADRKLFLTLPAGLKKHLSSFHTPTNKVCFHLTYAYFKACGRFFTPARFRDRDIEFVCRRMGIFDFSVDKAAYSFETFYRHKKLILEHFNYYPFNGATHLGFLKTAANKMIQSQFRPKLIFNFMVEHLRQKRIELPSYNTLQTLIAKAVREYAKSLLDNLDTHLTDSHKKAMDKLLERPPVNERADNAPYPLTELKNFDTTDSTKSIKSNIEKLLQIQHIAKIVYPLIDKLKLNPDAIRHYGELVIHYKIDQIKRRKALSKYLHLLAFVVYQLCQFEDQLTDILLLECKSVKNLVRKEHLERKLELHNLNKPTTDLVFNNYCETLDKEALIRDILWAKVVALNDTQLVQFFRQLFPEQVKGLLDSNTVREWQQKQESSDTDAYFDILESHSLALQKKVATIVKYIHFNEQNSDQQLLETIKDFRQKNGAIAKSIPATFLSDKENKAVFGVGDKFRISLFKVLFFDAICKAIKAGAINLKYSYRYKAFDEYLIALDLWNKNKDALLIQAQLSHLNAFDSIMDKLKKRVDAAFHSTNQSILLGENKYMRFKENGAFSVATPSVDKPKTQKLADIFPDAKIIPLSEILATVHHTTGYLNDFIHFQPKYPKERPNNPLFYAGITAYGCNLGIPTMTKVATPMTEAELENTVNAYFSLTNIDKANDAIVNFMAKMELPQLYKRYKDQLHTSSDGQKFGVKGNSVHSAYSYKYFKKGRGVTVYSHTDERQFQPYSTVISPAEREATYVVDGLIHNEVIKSTIHSTDTHGYTEAVFALTDLLGFEFAPRIARLYKQQLYAFAKNAIYAKDGYKILPNGYINVELIKENWDNILRLITSIKLKECSASQIFKRLNSYSRQHPVYKALKEYGKIVKTLFILKYIDDVELRQAIRKQLNKIENANRFSSAIRFANNGEFIFPTRQEQLIAESCTRLIKNSIICWNYMFLTYCIQNAETQQRKKEIIEAVKAGSVMAWQHIYFHGLYDFSDDKLKDSFNLIHSQNYSINLDNILV